MERTATHTQQIAPQCSLEQQRTAKLCISIVLPVFNEQKNILCIYQHLAQLFDNELKQFEHEFIFINDGSKDDSWHLIKQLALNDATVRAVSFSRNFGHQIALKAGYDHAIGDAIITMDADMQDSPSLIVSMIQRWREGSDIVYARRVSRKDPWLKKCMAHVYYKLLDSVSDVHIPRNVGDYRLIDKKVLHVITSSHERSYYWRGLVAWTGFKEAFVDFNRDERREGASGYTWTKMFKLAFDGITGFSLFPLKIAAYIGIFVILSGSAMFAYITIDALFRAVYYPLFKWLVTVIYILMGVQFLLLWLLGEYIGRMYEQQKDRPVYITHETVNCTK